MGNRRSDRNHPPEDLGQLLEWCRQHERALCDRIIKRPKIANQPDKTGAMRRLHDELIAYVVVFLQSESRRFPSMTNEPTPSKVLEKIRICIDLCELRLGNHVSASPPRVKRFSYDRPKSADELEPNHDPHLDDCENVMRRSDDQDDEIEPVSAPSEPPHLTPKQEDVLVTLFANDVISKRRATTATMIAIWLGETGTTSNNFKRAISQLQKIGFVETSRTRGRGVWLTGRGIEVSRELQKCRSTSKAYM